MATTPSTSARTKLSATVQRLNGEAKKAEAQADAAKQQVRAVKAELKKARKSFKVAKKAAKQARKNAETAAEAGRKASVKTSRPRPPAAGAGKAAKLQKDAATPRREGDRPGENPRLRKSRSSHKSRAHCRIGRRRTLARDTRGRCLPGRRIRAWDTCRRRLPGRRLPGRYLHDGHDGRRELAARAQLVTALGNSVAIRIAKNSIAKMTMTCPKPPQPEGFAGRDSEDLAQSHHLNDDAPQAEHDIGEELGMQKNRHETLDVRRRRLLERRFAGEQGGQHPDDQRRGDRYFRHRPVHG